MNYFTISLRNLAHLLLLYFASFRFYFVVCCHVKVENDDVLDFVDEVCVDVSRRMIEY